MAKYFYLTVSVLISAFFMASSSNAETLECTLKPAAGTLTVTDEKTKAPVATLKPGDFVYSRWHENAPLWAFVIKNGKFKQVEGLTSEVLDCIETAAGDYPIVFKDIEGVIELYNQFGIAANPELYDQDRKRLPKLPHQCWSVGAGHMGMELTAEAFAPYKKAGFDLKNLCMVLTSGQIRFDPETGKRLPTYVISYKFPDADGADLSDELPFFAPSCFARGKTKVEPKKNSALMNPLGCQVNFHPWSGRRLNAEEVAFFTREARLWAAGDAGEALEDSRWRNSANLSTPTKLNAVKDLLPR